MISLITKLTRSPEDIRKAYRKAQDQNDIYTLNEISNSYTIRAEFKFLGDFYEKCLKEQRYSILPLPHFSSVGEDFRGVVEKLTQERFQKGLIKKFGKVTENYGVNFLNNFVSFKNYYPGSELNIDEFLKLNHSEQVPAFNIYALNKAGIIFKRYRLERIMKLLLRSNDNEVIETNDMIKLLGTQEEVLALLPKKPKTFKEIHDALSTGLMKQKSVNVPLNQSISFLHGRTVGEFTIEVPAYSFDLIDTSNELNHCVHSYRNKILKKESQVLNLKQGKSRLYTIELVKTNKGYEIVQFRGKLNEDFIESSGTAKFKEEILTMICY